MKLKSIVLLSILASFLFNVDSVVAATRIRFARGSYCGIYSGNFSGGREFVLELAKRQTLTSRNTGRGYQYDVYVRGSRGIVRGNKVSFSQINYYIPRSGDYYIYVESSVPYSTIEFCAY